MKKRIGAVLAGALFATTLTACSGVDTSGGGEETIKFATVAGWDDTEAVTALWTALLEDRGYQVDSTAVDLAAGIAGVARGDLDGYLNLWLPSTHEAPVAAHRDDLVILDEPFFDDDRQVLVVPDFVEENTIEEFVQNSDKYGNKIVGIEAGSGNMKLLPDVMKTYGAEDKIDIVEGSTPAALAELEKATKNNEHVAISLWQPHWVFADMPVKALEDPKGGWPAPDGSYVGLSKKFAEAQPDIVKWMGNSKLTADQYASLMAAVNDADDQVKGARTWLEIPENKAAVDQWFN
ncbi:glycine betaine ABC transporter substrate-binding protein [Arthrobacter ginkgonis]|uniref:Glycine betaine ABC transporter substrate-binding protein n=1 Tax=Arthrobacter ginkgonis TaxID=1630594 RepID=A0ABP7C886_9MICC